MFTTLTITVKKLTYVGQRKCRKDEKDKLQINGILIAIS